jgi:heme exporter protein A
MNQLAVENLHLWRGEQHVLRGVSFGVQGGQCLQVLGANGAGKTTLLRALCGLTPLESGRIAWCGQDVLANRASYHGALAYLGHDNGLKGDLTAAENLRYALATRRRAGPAAVVAALERVGASELGGSLLRHLSAGQRRRVALARLGLMGAALWLLDEPGSNLDEPGQGLLGQLLAQHLSSGGIAVVATHRALELPTGQLSSLALQ